MVRGIPDVMEVGKRSMMAPPTGDETLEVRRAYLRKRRSRHMGTWRRTALWVIVAGVAGCLCIAGVSVLILGS
jgi:hypothetical protein